MKKKLTSEEYKIMIEKLENIDSAKKARLFHQEYKAYGYGLFWHDRYPKRKLVELGMIVECLSEQIAERKRIVKVLLINSIIHLAVSILLLVVIINI